MPIRNAMSAALIALAAAGFATRIVRDAERDATAVVATA